MLLEINKIFKTYQGNEHPAIQGISLKVKSKEFVSILGESGCGKSTLLRLVNGLDDVNEGLITINGERVKGPKDVLVAGHPLVEKVDQDYDVFPNHTVRETLEYKLQHFDDRWTAKRIKHLLNVCKLKSYEDQIPRLMSGGEQQRVAFAAALATEPEILLMDEPFSHLDPALRRRLKTEMKEVAEAEGITILFVTHDTQDALALSDRIIVMRKGKVVQKGKPTDLYERPKSKYVAEFFGPINDLREIMNSEEHRFIRPEKIQVQSTSEDNTIAATVTNTEYWGFQYFVTLDVEGTEIVAYHNSPIEIGTKVFIKLKK